MRMEAAFIGPFVHLARASSADARTAKKSKSCADPPRFERQCGAYKCVARVLQYADDEQRPQNWKYKNSSRCHMPNSETASAIAVTSAHAAVGRHRTSAAGS